MARIIGEVPANETPREKLLMRDVALQFWELRKAREEIKALKAENERLKKINKKLEYENDYFYMSNMQQ